MTEAYKFSNARQARASESNLRILFSTLPPFRSTTASVAAHARSPSLAQRAAARPCRPSERIEHSSPHFRPRVLASALPLHPTR
eukprot:scaffold2700_cov123-Isochrysis_galbana.AAC.4